MAIQRQDATIHKRLMKSCTFVTPAVAVVVLHLFPVWVRAPLVCFLQFKQFSRSLIAPELVEVYFCGVFSV